MEVDSKPLFSLNQTILLIFSLVSPQVRCDSELTAKSVCRQINMARAAYEERIQAVAEDDEDKEDGEE